MSAKVNLAEALATFSERWSPRTVAMFNGHDVMVVKAKGEFVWHKHDATDDFFLVLAGSLDIELREGTVTLGPGELYVVPKGVEHRPVAREEVHLLLIEPTGTPNTGDERTAAPRKLIRPASSGSDPAKSAVTGGRAMGYNVAHADVASAALASVHVPTHPLLISNSKVSVRHCLPLSAVVRY